MLSVCERGLRALEVHLDAVGSTELRVLATAQRVELVRMALRYAARRRATRDCCSTGASVAGRPCSRSRRCGPDGTVAVVAELAALRAVVRRLETGDLPDFALAALHRERRRREAAVREHVLQTPGTALDETWRFDRAELLDRLGAPT